MDVFELGGVTSGFRRRLPPPRRFLAVVAGVVVAGVFVSFGFV